MVTIDTKELYEILEETPAEQNIMLAGKHGIGKSEIITKFFFLHIFTIFYHF